MSEPVYDVVIVGGGPAGSTCATLLKKYNSQLRVVILEREKFPRDHIGESQLPSVSAILNEMGCWEKVEEAGFPIKLGATFTWGRDNEPWDLDFYPVERFTDEPRPARYEGQRRRTAFQVDRAVYDNILLRHAESVGVEVRECVRVKEIAHEDDHVRAFVLDNDETITGRWFVDASGAAGIVRRALGIESDQPRELRNIAIWDYWENAEWAVKIGVGGTRIQVRSLPYGWMWFIPLGPTRTSIGLVCPAAYYKRQGLSTTKLYEQALADEPEFRRLTQNATRTGRTQSIKDWSHCTRRACGTNWFLVGESAGFADPILSAGMALAHGSARECAYTILELQRGELEADWLRSRYDERIRASIRQHVRFAQFWYSANARFTDLKKECQSIAREAGVRLSPTQAWRWLAQGGWINHSIHNLQLGSFDVFSAHLLVERFAGRASALQLESVNELTLNLHGAERTLRGELRAGRIEQVECYVKGDRVLPIARPFQGIIAVLQQTSDAVTLQQTIQRQITAAFPQAQRVQVYNAHLQALESMLNEGWIIGRVNKKRPFITIHRERIPQFREHRKGVAAIEVAQRRSSSKPAR